MKSNAPWSVKGIKRDARETAKDAARREGMTVGEWLNQVIYQAGDPDASSAGDIKGLGVKDLVAAIEHLNRRLGAAESKSVDAINNFSRNLGGVVERLQRLERAGPEDGGAPESVAALEARLSTLESKKSGQERIEALKALEKAVSQAALHFDAAHKSSTARIEATERQLQEFASRLDNAGGEAGTAAFAPMREAMDALSARLAQVERIAEEAAKLRQKAANVADAEFVERTGKKLRVLGDEIKRGGDQIRALEQNIHKLSDQIDGAERRSSEGVQKVAETIAELRDQLGQAEAQDNGQTRSEIEAAVTAAARQAEERVVELQKSFETMIARLESADAAAQRRDEDGAKSGRSEPFEEIEERLDDDETEAEAAADAEDIDDEISAFEEIESNDADDAIDNEYGAAFDPFTIEDSVEDEEIEDQRAGPDEEEASDDDAFNFDLDTLDAEPAPPVGSKSPSQSILDEVREAFSKRPAQSRAPEAGENADPERAAIADNAREDNADAAIGRQNRDDGRGEPKAAAPKDDSQKAADDKSRRDAAKAMLRGQPDTESRNISREDKAAEDRKRDKQNEDFLKAARRAAREAAASTAPGNLTAREKIISRQKALFTSQARNKRLAREIGADGDRSTPKPAPMPAAAAPADDEEGGAAPSPFLAAISAIRSKIPFLDKSSGDDAIAQKDKADAHAGAGSVRLASAKPMTVALGVAIALAAAGLFFLVKDIIFGPPATPAASKPAIQLSEGASADAPTAPDAEPLAADPIRPRQLYLDSIAAFQSATDETQAAEALKGLEQAAALGHPPAQFQLAEFYKIGQGVEQDPVQSRVWYQRAATGGNVLAMHRLGVMTARGEGGPASANIAIEWFEKAANHGLVDSQFNLGTLYDPSNDGFTSSIQDAGKAYYWYGIAALNGDQQAGSLASGLASALTPEKKQELDADVAGWQALATNPEANELASASG